MKKILTALLLTASISCSANPLEINEIIAYHGTIANQQIFMTLNVNKKSVLGEYFYTKYKTPIALHGSIDDSRITLTESTPHGEANIKATLKAEAITGVWRHNKKIHDVHLEPLSKSYKDIINTITITHLDSGTRTLHVNFKSGITQNIEIETLTQSTSITFEDFTFDGYPDMRVLELEAGGNSSFLYFNYDVSSENYVVSSAEISSVVSPRIFHSENIIISISRDGCCNYLAKKIMSKELRSANYNYISNSGHEKTINKITKKESTKPIGKEYFELNYLNFMRH